MKHHARARKPERQTHIEHKRSAMSAYLKEVVYGGIDGIITTFAVVAGFSGAALSNESTMQISFLVVLLFGLSNLFADGVSMGLGNFLAVRSEQGLYNSLRAKEERDSLCNEDGEADETTRILIQRGFSEEDAQTLTAIYRKNDQYWVDFLMSNELKMPDPTGENAIYTGFATFVAFVSFGIIPLIPFVVMGSFNPETVFWFSTGGAGVALVILGILKWRIVGTGLVRSVSGIVLVGSVAAAVAFFVGTLFVI